MKVSKKNNGLGKAMPPSLPYIIFFLQYDIVVVVVVVVFVVVVVIVVVIIVVVVDGDDNHDDDDDHDDDDYDGNKYDKDEVISLKKNKGQGWAHNVVV